MFRFRLSRITLALVPLVVAAGCATHAQMSQSQRPETVYAVTAANNLVSFNAGAPRKLISSAKLSGLAAGETVAAMDFRPANGKLYAITNAGRLYVIDTASGAATRVGAADASAL